MPDTTNLSDDQSESLDFSWITIPLRRYWKRVVAIWLAVALIGVCVVLNKRPSYESYGRLFLEDNSPESHGQSRTPVPEMQPALGSTDNLESQKEILRGPELALKVINRVGMNAFIDGPQEYLPAHPKYWKTLIRKDLDAYANGLRAKDLKWNEGAFGPRDFKFRFENEKQFTVYDASDKFVTKASLGEPVKASDFTFTIHYQGKVPIEPGTKFSLHASPPDYLLGTFAGSLDVSGGRTGTVNNNIFRVSYTAESPFLAREVVQTLFEEFIAQKRYWATSDSRATLEFVDSQLNEMREDLDRSTARLVKLQKEQGVINLEPHMQNDLTQMVTYEVELRQVGMRIFELEQMLSSSRGELPDQYLLTSLNDPGVQKLSDMLSALNAEIAAMESQFQPEYPPLKGKRVEQSKMVAEMKRSLEGHLERARMNEKQLLNIHTEYKSRFSHLPEAAQSLTDHFRSTKVYEDLYLFLLQQKQKAKINEASTLSNIRVILHSPRIPLHVSSPSLLKSFMMANALGLAIGALAVVAPYFRIRLFVKTEDVRRAFVEPVIALIPHHGRMLDRASSDALIHKGASPFLEALRLLRTNLLYLTGEKNSQVVLFTSAMPGDGKSIILSNLANVLTKSERIKRVLVIDADMQNPSLHGIFNLALYPGLSEFLSGQAKLKDIIQTITLDDGREIDLICAGKIPPSPVELVEKREMQYLLEFARENYTFTLLDSPPFPMITTASILASKADRIMSICRLGQTDRNLYKQHMMELSKVNRNVCIIVNMADGLNGYGYDGRYGYGYPYAHRLQPGYGGEVAHIADRLRKGLITRISPSKK